MGRGDKKTKKGKMSMGSYGVIRPKKTTKKLEEVAVAPKAETPKTKPAAKAKTAKA